MSDTDPQSSDTSIPGESSVDHQAIPVTNGNLAISALPLQPPRLGIIHLLAWMTVTAVLFQINMVLAPGRPVEVNYALWSWIFRVIIQSAAITGAGIVLVAKYYGGKSYFQPGHFLLFFSSFVTFVNLALSRFFSLSTNTIDSDLFGFSTFLWTFPGILIFFWIASKIPEQGRWKNMFRAWGWLYLLNFVFGDVVHSSGARSQLFIYQMILLLFILTFAILFIAAIGYIGWE
jgi:hypothetical protein